MIPWIRRWEQLSEKNRTAAFLRLILAGVSQIVWNTNPVCALILLGALAVACPLQLLCCLWALTVAAATILLLRLPKDPALDGLYTINPALAGIAVPLVFFQNSPENLLILLLSCAAASGLSVVLCVLLRKWTSPRQLSPLGLPYSIVLLVMGVYVHLTQTPAPVSTEAAAVIWTVPTFLHAVLCGLAQVIWVEGVPNAALAGLLTLLGIFVVSRIDAAVALYSAVLSTLAAVLLGLDGQAITLGLYGYGGVLLSMVLFGRAYKISKYSFLLITIFTLLNVLLTASLRPLFLSVGAPVAAGVWSLLALTAMSLRRFDGFLSFVAPAHWTVPEASFRAPTFRKTLRH